MEKHSILNPAKLWLIRLMSLSRQNSRLIRTARYLLLPITLFLLLNTGDLIQPVDVDELSGQYLARAQSETSSDQELTGINPDLPLIQLQQFGVTGDGRSDNVSALKQAIISAQARKRQYKFPTGTFRIASDLEIPENLTLVFPPGAELNLDPGVKLKIDGKVKAGFKQIFCGKGSILGLKGNRVITPSWFGAKGDGINDDTAAIQKAMQEGKEIIFPPGQFLIDAATSTWGDLNGGVQVPSNVLIRMTPDTILKARPTASGRYQILAIYNRENVVISGGMIQGERDRHRGNEGEWGYGVAIGGSKNVRLEKVTAVNCWGDGFVVSSDSSRLQASRDIALIGCVARNNRRQGLSIIHCQGATIQNCLFSDTNGTAPQSGLDIEPNTGQMVTNIQILECRFLNNRGLGFTINATKGSVANVRFYNNTVTGSAWGIHLTRTDGNHIIENNQVKNCGHHGIRITNSRNIQLRGGTIAACASNLSLKNTVNCLVESVEIADSRSYGLQMTEANTTLVQTNLFKNNALGSMELIRSSHNRILTNRLVGNKNDQIRVILTEASSYNELIKNIFELSGSNQGPMSSTILIKDQSCRENQVWSNYTRQGSKNIATKILDLGSATIKD